MHGTLAGPLLAPLGVFVGRVDDERLLTACARAGCLAAQEATDDPMKCDDFRLDYMECLHHKKEFTRRNQVAAQLKKIGGVVPPPEDKAPAVDAAAPDAAK